MKYIIFPKALKEKLFKHLLKDPYKENMAALFCGYSIFRDNLQLLVRDIWLIEEKGLVVHSGMSLEMKEEMYREILLKCEESENSLIVVHSHPFTENAWFSSVDNDNDLENAKFIKKHLPDIYYGNMVVSQKDAKARIFNKQKEVFEDIQAISIYINI